MKMVYLFIFFVGEFSNFFIRILYHSREGSLHILKFDAFMIESQFPRCQLPIRNYIMKVVSMHLVPEPLNVMLV